MPADSPYNPDGSIDWSYFNKPAVSGQVYKYSPETGGYSTTLSLAEAQAQGYGSLSDTEKRNIYNTAAILNPDVGAAPFVLGQPAVGQAYRSMNTGDPVPVTKPVAAAAASGITAAATLKNGGNGKMANTGDNGEGLDLLGMDLSGILTALGIGGTTAATVTTIAGILGALRLKWPWQTVEGEGFIAPWSQQTETPQGWIQTAAYNQPGIPFALGAGGGAGGGGRNNGNGCAVLD